MINWYSSKRFAFIGKRFAQRLIFLHQKNPARPRGRAGFYWCAHQESNLNLILRRDVSYPLNDGREVFLYYLTFVFLSNIQAINLFSSQTFGKFSIPQYSSGRWNIGE